MSDTGLVFYIDKSKGTQPFLQDIALFIVECRASYTGNAVTAVDNLSLGILFDKGLIPGFFDALGNFIQRPLEDMDYDFSQVVI